MTLEAFGIICGFFAALCQALNYTFSKDCQEKYNLHGFRQLLAVHLAMLVMSGVPFMLLGYWRYISPGLMLYMAGVVGPYLMAQYIIIKILDRTDASIVSPLLTIKIPILAVIALVFMGRSFSLLQYVSIAAIISLGFYFSSLSGRAQPKLVLAIAAACTCYCISDISMAHACHFMPLPPLEAVIVCSCYEYVICGILALPFFRHFRIAPVHGWHAKWVAASWFTCTLAYVVTFSVNGVVEGNIIQTLRSVIGVLIAYAFYRKYIKDQGTFRKKLMITAGMFSAVACYYADDIMMLAGLRT